MAIFLIFYGGCRGSSERFTAQPPFGCTSAIHAHMHLNVRIHVYIRSVIRYRFLSRKHKLWDWYFCFSTSRCCGNLHPMNLSGGHYRTGLRLAMDTSNGVRPLMPNQWKINCVLRWTPDARYLNRVSVDMIPLSSIRALMINGGRNGEGRRWQASF